LLFLVFDPRFREAVSRRTREDGREFLGFFTGSQRALNGTGHHAGVTIRATPAVHLKHLLQDIVCGLRFAARIP
jgi:hypothetical protein